MVRDEGWGEDRRKQKLGTDDVEQGDEGTKK